MSLGNQTDNNKKNYSPILYSGVSMSNPTSEVDQTKLNFSLQNKLLKVSIAVRKGGTDERPEWDRDNNVAIWLHHTKALMLISEIEEFQKNPNSNSNFGVNSGDGLIYICNGKEFGVKTPCLVIKKINASDGSVESSYAYQFKDDRYYAIRNFEDKTSDFDKVYYPDLEINEFKILLNQYVNTINGVLAYSVIEYGKYDNSRINTKVNSICEKLGIEFKGNNNSSNKSSSSIFDKKEARNFSQSTIDDIESQLED